MSLTRLEITELRNLSRVILNPGRGINVLYGENASGKTSILEGIHLLALGRSFRGSGIKPLVTEGSESAVVFGVVEERERRHRIGIEKNRQGGTEIRIDGSRAHSAAELASLLPLQLITPASHSLIDGGPKERRAFLDWGLFHVEHRFFQQWKDYQRALRQRNEALRVPVDRALTTHWNRVLADAGSGLDGARQRYVDSITDIAKGFVTELLPGTDDSLDISYSRGWPGGLTLGEALESAFVRDKQVGYTTVGPHRADMRLRWCGRRAADTLSRGQQKLLVVALKLAQLQQLREATGRECTVLIDDLPAELDRGHRGHLLRLLARTHTQVFVTATEVELLDLSAWDERKVFHVEHGAVTEMV